MGISADEFLRLDGAIELFCELRPGGSRFSDLDDELSISHTTLTARLGEAQELDLIERKLVERDGDSVPVYAPTNTGARFMLELRRQSVRETYLLLKETRNRFEQRSDDVREWVRENPLEFSLSEDEAIKELYRYHTVGPGSEDDL